MRRKLIIVITIAEMAIQGELGVEVDIDAIPSNNLRLDELLFSESHGRFILTIKENDFNKVSNIINEFGIKCKKIGKVTPSKFFILNSKSGRIECNLDIMTEKWMKTISKFMGVE